MVSVLAIGILIVFWKIFIPSPPAPPSPKNTTCVHCGYVIPGDEGPCSGGCQIFEVKFRHRKGITNEPEG